jgi:hypothetical protein
MLLLLEPIEFDEHDSDAAGLLRILSKIGSMPISFFFHHISADGWAVGERSGDHPGAFQVDGSR